MVSSKQPPLVWLRAFEAAGRTGSFKAAAEELHVSPSTISHQIRDLESYLGVPLFHRSGRTPQLTVEGAEYLSPLQQGFEIIRTAQASKRRQTDAIRVGAFPFLANEILTPMLPALQSALPDRQVQLFTHNDLKTLTSADPGDRLDVVIRYGKPNSKFSGLVAAQLSEVSVLPIFGPNMTTPTSAASILDQTLIRVIGPFEGWRRWQDRFCPDKVLPDFAIETDSFHSAALAVSRGEGICLGVLPFIRHWLNEGRVIGLEQYTLLVNDAAVFAVYAPHNANNQSISILLDFLAEVLA